MATSRASSKRKVAVTQMHVALTSSSSFDDLVAAPEKQIPGRGI
jgi:hypothetical protein